MGDEELDVLLANALRKLRMEKGISQSRLARRPVGESSGGGSVSLLADYTRKLARVTP